jgi:hypothetical protein
MGIFHDDELAKRLSEHGMYVVASKFELSDHGRYEVTLDLHLDGQDEKLGHRVLNLSESLDSITETIARAVANSRAANIPLWCTANLTVRHPTVYVGETSDPYAETPETRVSGLDFHVAADGTVRAGSHAREDHVPFPRAKMPSERTAVTPPRTFADDFQTFVKGDE